MPEWPPCRYAIGSPASSIKWLPASNSLKVIVTTVLAKTFIGGSSWQVEDWAGTHTEHNRRYAVSTRLLYCRTACNPSDRAFPECPSRERSGIGAAVAWRSDTGRVHVPALAEETTADPPCLPGFQRRNFARPFDGARVRRRSRVAACDPRTRAFLSGNWT